MPGLLKSIPIDDVRRRENDRHRTRVVLAVLAMLSLYVYLFTQAAEPLGLPLPAELAGELDLRHVFDDDGNVEFLGQDSRSERGDGEVVAGAVAAQRRSAEHEDPVRGGILWSRVPGTPQASLPHVDVGAREGARAPIDVGVPLLLRRARGLVDKGGLFVAGARGRREGAQRNCGRHLEGYEQGKDASEEGPSGTQERETSA